MFVLWNGHVDARLTCTPLTRGSEFAPFHSTFVCVRFLTQVTPPFDQTMFCVTTSSTFGLVKVGRVCTVRFDCTAGSPSRPSTRTWRPLIVRLARYVAPPPAALIATRLDDEQASFAAK